MGVHYKILSTLCLKVFIMLGKTLYQGFERKQMTTIPPKSFLLQLKNPGQTINKHMKTLKCEKKEANCKNFRAEEQHGDKLPLFFLIFSRIFLLTCSRSCHTRTSNRHRPKKL